jgi:hypothetical protein
MEPRFILHPLLGMGIVTGLVLGLLGAARLQAVRARTVPLAYFKTFQGGVQSERLVAIARNLMNLFETPVLFYVITILLYVTARMNRGDVHPEDVALAWSYVALRGLHTLVHVTFNHVTVRFSLFVLSDIALFLLWASYFMRYSLG